MPKHSISKVTFQIRFDCARGARLNPNRIETDESLPLQRTSGGISCPRRSRLEARLSASRSACGEIAQLLFRELRDKYLIYVEDIVGGFRHDVIARGARQ